MADLIYMTKTAWQSLLSSIKTKAGYVGTLTASQAKDAVDGITAAVEIKDASYLFANNARTNNATGDGHSPDPDIVAMIKKPETMECVCYTSNALRTVDFSNIDFSECWSFRYAFSTSPNITDINLGNVSFFPGSAVYQTVNVAGMFNGCQALRDIHDIFKNPVKVGTLMSLFQSCQNLTSIDVSGIDTSAVTDFSSAFSGCRLLGGIDVSGFDTSRVTTMSYCFNQCYALTFLDVSAWTIGATCQMQRFAAYCENLEEIRFGENVARLGHSVTNFNVAPFAGDTNLKVLRIKATTPPTMPSSIVLNTQNGSTTLEHIYVPNDPDIIQAYKTATNWSLFEDIIEGDPLIW